MIILNAPVKRRIKNILSLVKAMEADTNFIKNQLAPILFKRRLAFADYQTLRVACRFAAIHGNSALLDDANTVLNFIDSDKKL